MVKTLVISDIHGNLEALKAVIEDAKGFDEMIVLGDLVDYGPSPAEVIDTLRQYSPKIVRGNHDHAVAFGVDCRCGEKTHWISVWFRENITLKLLTKKDKEYLASLPLEIKMNDITAVHASPSNPLYAYVYPWITEEEVCNNIRGNLTLSPRRENECSIEGVYLIGHTHFQFHRVSRGAIIANPGSVGQPRDSDPRASYMLLDAERGSFEYRRVKYDVEKTIEKIKELGVKDPYLNALAYILRNGKVQ